MMKRQETEHTYRFEWTSDNGGDTAFVALRPLDDYGDPEGRATLYRRNDTGPTDRLDFYHPDDLEAFGNELVKLAGEMRKWPQFKPARKAARR